jgi:hypothetical protein
MNSGKLCCGAILITASLAAFCIRHLAAVWLAVVNVEEGLNKTATGGYSIIQKNIGLPLLIFCVVVFILGFFLILTGMDTKNQSNEPSQ